MKTRFLLCVAAICACCNFSYGQANVTYTFQLLTGNYMDLVNGDTVSMGEVWDDPDDYEVNLGFNFKMFNESVSKVYINGLGGTISTGPYSTPIPIDTINAFSFANDFADMANFFGGSVSLSPIIYKLEGTAPNRIGKLQWTKAGFYDDSSGTDYINYQVWLYEGSNNIDVLFGVYAIADSALDWGGPGPTFILADRLNPTYDTIIGKLYGLTGSITAPVLSDITNDTVNFPFLNGNPQQGRVFRFVYNGANSVADTRPALANNVLLAPNPVRDRLHITYTGKETAMSVLTDLTGKMISTQTINSGGGNIDMSSLPAGVYMLSITAPGFEPYNQKIMKQ